MKKIILNIIILCCIGLTALNAQGNKNQNRQYNSEEERKRLITNFRNTYEQARERIDDLQENAPLRREVTYEKEEEVLRHAQQILGLMDDGHYVKRSEIKEWERRLNNLGNKGKAANAQEQPNNSKQNNQAATSENRRDRQKNDGNQSLWNERVIRADKIVSTSADRIESSRQRIILAKKRLDEQRENNKITEAEYKSKMNRVRQAEDRINNLEQKVNQEKQRVSDLKQHIDKK